MIEFLMLMVMYIGAAISVVLLLGLVAFILFVINEETKAVFKHRRNDRFANKLFNKIEEYRRDFA